LKRMKPPKQACGKINSSLGIGRESVMLMKFAYIRLEIIFKL
jgi:hypothetical protein